MRTLLLLALLVAPRPARAAPTYVLELRNAIAVPIGGSAYTQLFDYAYAGALRLDATFRLARNVELGPCVEVEGVASNTSEVAFEQTGRDARFGRVRGLAGAMLRLKGRYLELWVRVQAGVDSITGVVLQDAVRVEHVSSQAPALVPEVGWVVPISRAFVGLGLTFPIGFGHRLAPLAAASPHPATFATQRGDSVDFELGLFVGVRL